MGTARFTEKGILLIYVCLWDALLTTFEEAAVPFPILLVCLLRHLLGPSWSALFSLPIVFHHVLWFYLLVYFCFAQPFLEAVCVVYS